MAAFFIEDVAKSGLCVGCGACAVATERRIKLVTTKYGCFVPNLDNISIYDRAVADKVCPFSDVSQNEDQIAKRTFSEKGLSYVSGIGFYSSTWFGHINNEARRARSSSGALTSWLLVRLLEARMIDGVIHVSEDHSASRERLFGYCISEEIADVSERTKSQYYTCEFSNALLAVRGNGKKYAIVGVPCMIKAARLLVANDEILGAQIKYFVALVCGHMKSPAFAELLAWQVGVRPAELSQVDFRVKVAGKPANAYSFGARSHQSSRWFTKTSNQLVGGNWGHAMFQLKSCDYCDDIFGETADVCFGDAWLPQFEKDWLGTNIVVCRDRMIEQLMREGQADGHIRLGTLNSDDVIRSQSANFRHRWDGLSVRLGYARRTGTSAPIKRIRAGSIRVSMPRRFLIRLRQEISKRSHHAFWMAKQKEDLDYFLRRMRPFIKLMKVYYHIQSFAHRVQKRFRLWASKYR